MRPRWLGWIATLLLLALPAVQPLLSKQLTCGFDNEFHLWRAVQVAALWQEGVFFSRWAPHMAQGYGYPLFLFQAPFSAYLAAAMQEMGLAWPVAVNVVYGIGLVGSGVTMWLLARDVWGERGAVVAAVAYLYAPFHAYVLFYRASLSETVAWLFPPLFCGVCGVGNWWGKGGG